VSTATVPATKLKQKSADGTAQEAFQSIDIDGDVIALHSFQICSADVVAYLAAQATEDQARSFIRAVEVGVYCLERASSAKDTEFVKRQIERLLSELESRVSAIPAQVQDQLLKKVGTGDGQVLKPIFDASQLASNDVKQRIAECRTFVTEHIDATAETSSVGKALKVIKDMLNPVLPGSVQNCVDLAVAKVTATDGMLAKTVKATVEAALKPLQDEVKDLGKEIRAQEAAEQVLMQTTAKGPRYEEQVIEVLQPWAKNVGAELERVGADNRPGDVLVTLTRTSLSPADVRVVIETRDEEATARGRKVISNDVANAMTERSANAGIYLSRTPDGLGREIGDWGEGECAQGPWVATTHEHLRTAIRFLVAQHRLRTLRSQLPDFDTVAIENHIKSIRTALDRIKTIKSKVTTIRSTADGIGGEADGIREEVVSALRAIEDAMLQASAVRVSRSAEV